MLVKFIKTGKKAKSAQQYLFQEQDHNGKVREGIELLRGNPNSVTELADSLKFKNKYRSAVIAFAKDDNPTQEQINEILDEFEKFAFAGLESNQYTYYAVKHIDNGVPHIHIIVPNVELQSGKALNIAPPNWEKSYGLFQDYINLKYNFTNPRASDHKRLIKPSYPKLENLKKREVEQQINDYMSFLLQEGLLSNHQEVIKELEKLGEITRVGKDYISLKPQGFKRAIRFKGEIYGREFDINKLRREDKTEKTRANTKDYGSRERELKRVTQELEGILSSRAEYNQKRYKPKEPRVKRRDTKQYREDREANYKLYNKVSNKNIPKGELNDRIRKRIIADSQRTTEDIRERVENYCKELSGAVEKHSRKLHNSIRIDYERLQKERERAIRDYRDTEKNISQIQQSIREFESTKSRRDEAINHIRERISSIRELRQRLIQQNRRFKFLIVKVIGRIKKKLQPKRGMSFRR